MVDNKDGARDIPISFDSDEAPEATSEPDADDPTGIEEVAVQDDPTESASQQDDAALESEPELESEPQPDLSAALQTQIDELLAEKTSLYDKLIRRQAEFENYRKRVERERSELYQRGRDDVLLQFLPVVDNFERALSSLETSEGDAEALRHGVELIHKQFKDALAKFGLEEVEAVGQAFDPHVHEAITTEATDQHKENTVIAEFQRGYKIGDRLLRPSKVKVASTPEK